MNKFVRPTLRNNIPFEINNYREIFEKFLLRSPDFYDFYYKSPIFPYIEKFFFDKEKIQKQVMENMKKYFPPFLHEGGALIPNITICTKKDYLIHEYWILYMRLGRDHEIVIKVGKEIEEIDNKKKENDLREKNEYEKLLLPLREEYFKNVLPFMEDYRRISRKFFFDYFKDDYSEEEMNKLFEVFDKRCLSSIGDRNIYGILGN